MGEIVKFKKPSLKEKAEGKTLCKSGFHNSAGSGIGRAIARPKGEPQGCGESQVEGGDREEIRRQTGKTRHVAALPTLRQGANKIFVGWSSLRSLQPATLHR
ncbi:MAG TPA: hypothetical protein VEI74_02430 [Candidatus Methylomirabilis sp.]|nr:hypothetical protein [Candidatus Methylomirabilis sp.]